MITPAHLKSHNITVAEYRSKYNTHICSPQALQKMSSRRKTVAKTINESNGVKCEICGQFHKALNLHLHYKHKITPEEYLLLYPHAKLYSQETKQKMKDNSFMLTQRGITFEQKMGTERAAQQKAILSASATLRQTGTKRTEEYKQKMRDVWSEKHEEWSKSIREGANTPETKLKRSLTQKKRIERDGYHLAWGKQTSIEKFVRETFEELGFTVLIQVPTTSTETRRFFDVYIKELNLIIEADGEYWHASNSRIEIDREKTEAAIREGYSFLRISDSEFNLRRNNKTDLQEKLLALSKLDTEAQLLISNELLRKRELKNGL